MLSRQMHLTLHDRDVETWFQPTSPVSNGHPTSVDRANGYANSLISRFGPESPKILIASWLPAKVYAEATSLMQKAQ